MGRLFGTDGVRGVANKDLTNELAMKIGMAAAEILLKRAGDQRPTVMIGRDTRASGDMLEAALTAGFCSVGVNVLSVGVVPTPAIAYLVGKYGCEAGVMISASHNPCEYNGIKIFQSTGYKLPDSVEDEIEAIILDSPDQIELKTGGDVGRRTYCKTAVEDYIEHIVSVSEVSFDGLNIAIDTANGSASVCAKEIFTRLGAKCHMLSDTPNGVNINLNCGSTHIEVLRKYVAENHLDAGFAFDGDADRCLAVDEHGNLVDGDAMIYIYARYLKERGKLVGNKVVTTVMSNFGLYKALDELGIEYEKTAVGDKYVYENMANHGYRIGGEQSGHIIFRKYATTGDGILTAIKMMEVMLVKGQTLAQLAEPFKVYPQVLENVRVKDKQAAMSDKKIQEAVSAVEDKLGSEGRILVRESGTEPLVRVMVEAPDQAICQAYVKEVVDVIKARAYEEV